MGMVHGNILDACLVLFFATPPRWIETFCHSKRFFSFAALYNTASTKPQQAKTTFFFKPLSIACQGGLMRCPFSAAFQGLAVATKTLPMGGWHVVQTARCSCSARQVPMLTAWWWSTVDMQRGRVPACACAAAVGACAIRIA